MISLQLSRPIPAFLSAGKRLLGLAVIGAAWFLPMAVYGAEGKPNIIVLVADDLNNDLGYLGSTVTRTPHIDALAKRGVAFSNAYAQAPLCNPSRTSILSGLRPETHRVVDNVTPPNHYLPDILFFPEYFRQNGWTTFGVGKTCQMGRSDVVNERSFDRYWALGHSKHDQKSEELGSVSVVGGRFQVLDGDEALITDSVRTHYFVKELEGLAKGKKPFLAYLGFHITHFGAMIPKRFFDQYPMETVPPLRDEPRGHLDGLRSYQGGEIPIPPTDETRQEVLEDRQGYYATIAYLDDLVGKIFAEMDRLKIWDNTIVVFVSDHGMLMGEHGGQVGKGNLLREAVRAPLIIYAPNEPGNGQICRRVVEFIDIFPTLTELAGLAQPPGLDGRSLVPLLKDPNARWDHIALSTHLRGRYLGQAVTTDKWRYIQWEDVDRQQLYNIQDDPNEFENLATDPAYQPVIDQLREELIQVEVPLERRKKKAKN